MQTRRLRLLVAALPCVRIGDDGRTDDNDNDGQTTDRLQTDYIQTFGGKEPARAAKNKASLLLKINS